MDCIFCKIVNGDIPCMKIYEDDNVLAYLDINPDCDGHTLIIPKKHYKDFFDIEEKELNNILNTAKEVMKILKEKLNCDGFSLVQNNGNIQEVKHFHLHIKPTYIDKKSIELIKNSDNIKDPKEIFEIIKEA